jgi:hydroxymethylglutaryl-CoA reductase
LQVIKDKLNLAATVVAELENQSLDVSIAQSMIENQISQMELPLGLGVNLRMNEKEYIIPMATEEPSVIAAMSNGAKMAGNFEGQVVERLMNGQIVFYDVQDTTKITQTIQSRKKELFDLAIQAYPSIVKRGGGLRDITTRVFENSNFVSVDFKVDVQDAMGANIVNTILETIAQEFRQWFDEEILFSILSNYSLHSTVKVRAVLDFERVKGEEVARKIALASDFANIDPYRATTHNKGIMNGIEAVVLATGNDTRAVSASVHAFASRNGQYQALSKWFIQDEKLVGEMEIPLAIATKGGATNVLPKSKAALEILQVNSAPELAQVMAAVGLSSNLAALRALVSEGIQKGHMALQAKSLAMSVGAKDEEIVQLSRLLRKEKMMNQEIASKLLKEMR